MTDPKDTELSSLSIAIQAKLPDLTDREFIWLIEGIKAHSLQERNRLLDKLEGQIDAVDRYALNLIDNYKEANEVDKLAPVGYLRIGTDELRLFINAERRDT